MNGRLQAAITADIDTLASIYKGRGCRRRGGYTHAELAMGLENFVRFLEPYGIKATLFMVGDDFHHEMNYGAIRAVARAGHEIGNHTLSHAQGFRWLSPAEKEVEIAGMEEWCLKVIGKQPTGFRSPGWNIGDDAIPILERRGYRYDSSVHPTCLTPLLKLLHWCSHSQGSAEERTTLGQWSYMFAPTRPYRTDPRHLGRRGEGALLEFPLTVVPLVRLPFWATFTLATGFELFRASYLMLKATGGLIQYQFHLSDFVDYSHPDVADQVPEKGQGVYVPLALQLPLARKLDFFRRLLDAMVEDCDFKTLSQWASEF